MISRDFLLCIHRKLSEIKDVGKGVVFGNIYVIALGDFFHVPPVRPGKYLFYSKFKVINLWENLFQGN